MAKMEFILFQLIQLNFEVMGLTVEQIRTAMQIALLGEIYPEIRAIVYAYDSIKKSLLVRYYLTRQPTDYDYESVSEVMTELLSQFKYSEFDQVKEECQYSSLPLSRLDPLDGFVYSRKEGI